MDDCKYPQNKPSHAHRKGCRCERCTGWQEAEYKKRRDRTTAKQADKRAAAQELYPDCAYPENTPRTAYGKGCRCDRCRANRSANAKQHYKKNSEERKAESRQYYADNREAVLDKQREVYRNRDRSKDDWSAQAAWAKRNPEKRRAHLSKYRALKKQATFGCPNRVAEIETEFRQRMPEGHHLDHVHPLSRDGLHHPLNWASAPASENMAKGARSTDLTPNSITFNQLMAGVYSHQEYFYIPQA